MTPVVFRTMGRMEAHALQGWLWQDHIAAIVTKTTVAREKSALDGPISIKDSRTMCFLLKVRRIRLYGE